MSVNQEGFADIQLAFRGIDFDIGWPMSGTGDYWKEKRHADSGVSPPLVRVSSQNNTSRPEQMTLGGRLSKLKSHRWLADLPEWWCVGPKEVVRNFSKGQFDVKKCNSLAMLTIRVCLLTVLERTRKLREFDGQGMKLKESWRARWICADSIPTVW